jgi:hemolysin III
MALPTRSVVASELQGEEAVSEPPSWSDRPRLRGRLHLVATVLSAGALVWLVRSAATFEARLAAWVYGLAAILCYLTSSTYHVFARTDAARRMMRRADHSMIYVLIAGTFTPVCILAMSGWWRWLVLGVVWVGAVSGVAAATMERLPRFRFALYLILGWAALITIPALSKSPGRLALVLAAGLLYTVGAVLFGLHRPRWRSTWFGYHELWHSLGVTAGALLFAVNLSLVAARAS